MGPSEVGEARPDDARPPGEHLEQDQTKRVDVRALIREAGPLLRSHVGGRAAYAPLLALPHHLTLARGSSDARVPDDARAQVAARIPWASSENLARIVSQGMYFAWKDGA